MENINIYICITNWFKINSNNADKCKYIFVLFEDLQKQ